MAKPTWGENLKRAIEDRGFNQAEFARILGFSRSHITRLVKGQRKPSQFCRRCIEHVLAAFPPRRRSPKEEEICREDG